MAKKILIAYATAGIGHKKAALAVRDALIAKNSGADVKVIDVLDYTNPFFKVSYPNVYLLLINKLILLWGFLYYTLDGKVSHYLLCWFREFYHVVNSFGLIKLIRDYKPDVVVSTHFLMPDVCYFVKKRYKLSMHVINVVTDYRAHSFWISRGVDSYVCAEDETFNDLTSKWQIPKDRVRTLGIPVEPKFSAPHDRSFFRKKLNIPEKNFTALILSGGYGVGPMSEIVSQLASVKEDLSVIVVSGHNEVLFNKVEEVKKKTDMQIINFGFVNTVDELMSASDIYIGKAGGISTAEAICMGLPLIYVRPIPGQESRNADLVIKRKGARRIKDILDIVPIVSELKQNKEKLNAMRQGIKTLQKNSASSEIADYILKI